MPYAIDVRIGVGGEFFIDKTLIDGARQLSVARNCVAVNLITNLSFPFQQYLSFLKDFALSKVAIIASYHDTQIKDKQEWLETAERMNGLVDFAIAVVAWPPILKRLAEIKKMFEERGLYVFMQAFQGLYEGKKFPESYSGEERVLLRKLFYSQHDYDYMVELKKPGLCYAGVDYVYLDIDGNIYRCGMTKMRLGNILKDHYRLLSEAKSCPMSHCPCDKENLNTKDFREHYGKTGLNQHKYVDKLSDPGRTTVVIRPSLHGVG
jgi:MoaA/NifB/PqqE/SkfB family radical SAM enzyme